MCTFRQETAHSCQKILILSHDTVPLSGLKVLPGVARLSAEGAQYYDERIAKPLTQFLICTVHVICRIYKIIVPAKIMSREQRTMMRVQAGFCRTILSLKFLYFIVTLILILTSIRSLLHSRKCFLSSCFPSGKNKYAVPKFIVCKKKFLGR